MFDGKVRETAAGVEAVGGEGLARTGVEAPVAGAAEAMGGDVGRQGDIVGIGGEGGEDFAEKEAGAQTGNDEHPAAADEAYARLPGPVALVDGGSIDKTAHRTLVTVRKLPCQSPQGILHRHMIVRSEGVGSDGRSTGAPWRVGPCQTDDGASPREQQTRVATFVLVAFQPFHAGMVSATQHFRTLFCTLGTDGGGGSDAAGCKTGGKGGFPDVLCTEDGG